ncbi:hypothetical protein FNV43_RR21899 [Rhamnella rubrinervis]|uniref:Uncharacterized protein n=1 Tax=Rhamnella rubrinervis TaxID=2594499 RepID=A0A8K0DT98_9ROSA|nr:hypothetical protein FNV43_RR21899 [Rhamnella rubrinervis]
MISHKKLIKLARKWQKIAVLGRKRISFPTSNGREKSVADKGHFVIYTVDQIRFELPLRYLNNIVFRELFKLSEEEFGISSGAPITLPCDSVFMSYLVSLIRQGVAQYLENALLNSISTSCCSSSTSFHQRHTEHQQLLVCGY